MKEQELFTAIGGVEDRFLEELEQPQIRRLPKHFGLIAALIALLLTACAAPVVLRSFDKVTGGNRAETGGGYLITEYGGPGCSQIIDQYFVPAGVDLEVAVDPDAPQVIQEHFLPTKFLEYCQVESYVDTEQEFSLSLSMKVPRYGRAYGIFYFQRIIPENGQVHLEWVLDSREWDQRLQTYGNMTVLEFTGNARYEDADGGMLTYNGNNVARINTKQIFWSDGFYLFGLKIPLVYPLDYGDVEEILASLTEVEDMSEYLPTAE